MVLIAVLIAVLLLLQWRFGRLARKSQSRMMGPGDEWEPEDVDRWLDLIEPFPLPERRRERR